MHIAHTPGDYIMASGDNLKAAESTYGDFVNLFKWGSVAVALVAILVIALIA